MTPDIARLPSVSLEDRKQLPHISGIYFVTGGDGGLLYVGSSVDICQRWAAHHVAPLLLSLEGVRIAWMDAPRDQSRLDVERRFIKTLVPPLNVVGVPRLGRLPARQADFVTVNVRLPGDIHAELVSLADEDDRSLNGEIVHAVRQFIAARRQSAGPRLLHCAESPAAYDTNRPRPAE